MTDAPHQIPLETEHLISLADAMSEAGELLTDRHLLADLTPGTRNRLHDIGRNLMINGWRLTQLVHPDQP